MNNNHKDYNRDEQDYSEAGVVLPKKIKLELRTSVEFVVMITFALSLLPTIISIISFFVSDQGFSISFPILFFALSMILFIIYKNVDEYYVVDTNLRSLMLSRKIFFYGSYTCYVKFESIDSVAANGAYTKPQREPGFWEYRPEIVLHNGKVIPIGDWLEGNYGYSSAIARKFSKMTKIHLSERGPKAVLVPDMHKGKYVFRHKVFKDSVNRFGFLVAISCVIFAVGLGLILLISALSK